MPDRYILALDQGTTSSRAILFDHKGTPHSVAQREFRQIYPRAGWVEHDAEEIWTSQSEVALEAMREAGVDKGRIAAVGITNQRETTVVWERETGKPVGNAIVWQDRRTADFCGKLKREGHEEAFTERTGLRLDPYFSGTKLRWILDHTEGARERAERGELLFGTVDSWLLWKLTDGEVHATDATNASRTLLFNIHELDWDDTLLEILGVPRAMLPEVRSCSETYGEIAKPAALAGMPVAGIAGDQQAALFGQSCFDKGMAKNTYGTGCFLLMNTGAEAVPSKNNLLTTIALRLGGRTEYALEGSVFIAGAVVQWLRDELGIVKSAPECSELAATVDDSNGVYLVPAFAGLGAPQWDPYARGTIVGLTRGAGRAHICRAALDSIAFQSADLLRCMEADSGIKLAELRVDGGASQSEALMQFQADLLQTTVVRPKCVETTALGAAYLAGLAVGYWKDREDIARHWQIDKRYKPARSGQEARRLQRHWDRAVERSLQWVEEE